MLFLLKNLFLAGFAPGIGVSTPTELGTPESPVTLARTSLLKREGRRPQKKYQDIGDAYKSQQKIDLA